MFDLNFCFLLCALPELRMLVWKIGSVVTICMKG